MPCPPHELALDIEEILARRMGHHSLPNDQVSVCLKSYYSHDVPHSLLPPFADLTVSTSSVSSTKSTDKDDPRYKTRHSNVSGNGKDHHNEVCEVCEKGG